MTNDQGRDQRGKELGVEASAFVSLRLALLRGWFHSLGKNNVHG